MAEPGFTPPGAKHFKETTPNLKTFRLGYGGHHWEDCFWNGKELPRGDGGLGRRGKGQEKKRGKVAAKSTRL